MPRYRIEFVGRQVGAIGVTYRQVVEVEAENEEAAGLKLYDTHEHIHGAHIRRIEEPTT
jgi:hypothetical protein